MSTETEGDAAVGAGGVSVGTCDGGVGVRVATMMMSADSSCGQKK